MEVLMIGLGSMGARRTRNLQSLGYKNISGFDLREDRRKDAANKYGIETFSSFDAAVKAKNFDVFVISVPPDMHHIYMKHGIEMQIPCFVEASVVDTGFAELIAASKSRNVLIAPSCTLYFHPAIKRIFEMVRNNQLGRITNVLMHSGQYLPDWHPYEGLDEYYVSNKSTGGAREIVPFELTWLTLLFGLPDRVAGMYMKTTPLEGAPDIDDTYNILFDYKKFILNLTVDVVSRSATRRLVINGDKKQLYWSWDDNAIKIFDPVKNEWEVVPYKMLDAHAGYNKNITEQMYIDEMNEFLNAAKGHGKFTNTLEMDWEVLKLLYKAESSSDSNQFIVTK